MAYTFDLTATDDKRQIALVRNEIDDVSSSAAANGGVMGTDYFLSDERITAFLQGAAEELPNDANSAETRLMAASAAEGALAKNQAFVLKKARTLGREDDGPAVGAEIRQHAESLRKRAWTSISDRRTLAAQEAAQNAATLTEPMGGNVPLVPTF